MGKRGPKPKPAKLKILEDNPGRRPVNDREPEPKRARPTCPTWLSKEAKAEWRRLVPELDRLGLLTIVDRTVLAACCQAAAELEYATALLNKEGRIVTEPVMNRAGDLVGEKLRAHPAVKLQRDAFARVKQYEALFGLSPSSRTNLKTPPKQEADPFEDFLSDGRQHA